MLDAYIIDKLKREKEEREREQWQPTPLPLEEYEREPLQRKKEEPVKRVPHGVVIMELSGSALATSNDLFHC